MKKVNEYVVKDIIPADLTQLKIIFLLESPYSSELIHEHPLAGSSGLSVSRLLNTIANIGLNIDIPFGCYLKANSDYRFAIINCCTSPMDKSVYVCEYININHVNNLDVIRRNPDTKSVKRQNNVKQTHISLINDLKIRLKRIQPLQNIHILACGKLASNFIAETSLFSSDKITNLPHPSYGQWEQNTNSVIIAEAKEAIRSALAPVIQLPSQ